MKKVILSLLCLALLMSSLVFTSASGELMYLIKDSDTRQLTEAELWEWDYESLGYILNEIFARKGYDFIPGEKYDVYFRSMPWYTPNNSNDNNRTCYSKLSSVEWYNERLVKQVRQKMRDTKNYNKSGKSVWTKYSNGFDVIQGFDYVEFKKSQKLAVYSAPSTSSWRGANGKASVSTNGAIYTDGCENGWLMVMYETNNGGVRVGYIDKSKVSGKVSGSAYNEEVAFGYLSATITSNCTLTDDPATRSTQIMSLPAGKSVTYLTTYINRNAWAYIETYTADGQLCRGFIPANCIDQGDYEDEIGSGYNGEG